MREILFRGKRADNGEWVEGVPYEEYMICGMTTAYYDDEVPMSKYSEFDYIEVLPDTVGQYTGLTDKNGKKIFEGDILSVGYVDSSETRNCEVRFGEFADVNGDGDIMLGFFLVFNGFECSILNGKDSGYSLSDVCEVIGNIYDNSDLLKEGAE